LDGNQISKTEHTGKVTLTGKQTLILIVDSNGVNSSDWADARLIKFFAAVRTVLSGGYYLRARYYDPANARILSEDSVTSISRIAANGQTLVDPLSLNRYSYCFNNPVKYSDPSGYIPVLLVTMGGGALIGMVVGGGVNIVAQGITKGWDNISWGEVGISVASGAISGALSGSGLNMFAVMSIDAFLGAGTYAATQTVNDDEITLQGLGISMGTGAFGGWAGGNSKGAISELRLLQDAIWQGTAYGKYFTSGVAINQSQFFDVSRNFLRASFSPTVLSNVGNYFIPYGIDNKDNFLQLGKDKLMELQKLLGVKQTGVYDDATEQSIISLQIAGQMALNPKLTLDDFLPNGWLKPLPPGGRSR
jgi:RHS repeat-associated protein